MQMLNFLSGGKFDHGSTHTEDCEITLLKFDRADALVGNCKPDTIGQLLCSF